MRFRWDVNTLTSAECYGLAIELKGGCAGKHKKELARSRVEVLDLAATRRDALLNHTEVGMFEQMPPFANTAPRVVFGDGLICCNNVRSHFNTGLTLELSGRCRAPHDVSATRRGVGLNE